ncbi:hypothetical protein [uncultured Prevotella sp.]|uniref:hypothetical protein n=1 Tax=uncultured Prevotella sp. TaxID=159272 RepID=UPI0026168EBC|nr:hypothetical protein [uncultured Prevotella sp.]
MKQDTTAHSERSFSSLDDIRAYKEELREQIRQDRDVISTKWNDLFHKEEPAPQNKAQKIMKMLSLGTGVLDGAMLGWKLYRKYQEGAFLFGKRRRK